jgi:hypothetical protein
MKSILEEKIAVCYTCCGPTYRESTKKQLNTKYFDDDNIYYCILTDDKSYFDDVKLKNLVVNELKDFYKDFPNLEKNEAFLESKSKEEYGSKFIETNYLFPFSTYRFNLLQAINLGISNITLLCTDTYINLKPQPEWGFEPEWGFNNNIIKNKNTIRNAISWWSLPITEQGMEIVSNILKENFNLISNDVVSIVDAAARLFVFENVKQATKFFNLWNSLIEELYLKEKINVFEGSYVIHDEYILAPLYNVFKFTIIPDTTRIFTVKHDSENERFWLD